MAKILAIDLGKFNSVTCLLDTETNSTEFWRMSTDRQYLLTVLKNYTPDLVVIESCGLAGWVSDVPVAVTTGQPTRDDQRITRCAVSHRHIIVTVQGIQSLVRLLTWKRRAGPGPRALPPIEQVRTRLA